MLKREELIILCEAAIVPVDKWRNRDFPAAHEQVSLCWGLLRAGCKFSVITESRHAGDDLISDENTIWLEITWPSFNTFEFGEGCEKSETFYLPTKKRLEDRKDRDWY